MTSCVEIAVRDRGGQVHFFVLPHGGMNAETLARGDVWEAELAALEADGATAVDPFERPRRGPLDPYLGHFLIEGGESE